MQYLVLEASLRTPYVFTNTPQQHIATGEAWPGWNIYADTKARELVVDVPYRGVTRRIVVPFENVIAYQRMAPTKPASVKGSTDGWATIDD